MQGVAPHDPSLDEVVFTMLCNDGRVDLNFIAAHLSFARPALPTKLPEGLVDVKINPSDTVAEARQRRLSLEPLLNAREQILDGRRKEVLQMQREYRQQKLGLQ